MPAPCHLDGRGVLVTRPAGQAAGLCRLIEEAGGRAIPFPTIRIAAPADSETPRQLLAGAADLLIFISRNAVEHSLPLFRSGRLPTGACLVAVGRATAQALEAAGRGPDLAPEGRYDSEALLALPTLQDLHGQRVIIVRGEGGSSMLGDGLIERGANLAYAEVYRRALPDSDPKPLLSRWWRDVHLVTATSGEILDNLLDLLGDAGLGALLSTPLVVVSERTRGAAQRIGFRHIELAERADEQSIVGALCRAAARNAMA